MWVQTRNTDLHDRVALQTNCCRYTLVARVIGSESDLISSRKSIFIISNSMCYANVQGSQNWLVSSPIYSKSSTPKRHLTTVECNILASLSLALKSPLLCVYAETLRLICCRSLKVLQLRQDGSRDASVRFVSFSPLQAHKGICTVPRQSSCSTLKRQQSLCKERRQLAAWRRHTKISRFVASVSSHIPD